MSALIIPGVLLTCAVDQAGEPNLWAVAVGILLILVGTLPEYRDERTD